MIFINYLVACGLGLLFLNIKCNTGCSFNKVHNSFHLALRLLVCELCTYCWDEGINFLSPYFLITSFVTDLVVSIVVPGICSHCLFPDLQ